MCLCSRKELVHQIGQGLDKCDVLITSGGVSMGEKVIAQEMKCPLYC